MTQMGTAPALGGIHHVAYRCRDAARSVQFYRDVLGKLDEWTRTRKGPKHAAWIHELNGGN